MAQKGAVYAIEEAYRLLDSQKFTDFVIRCDGQDFHVHRLIIYHKSEYFRAIFDNDFKENSEGILELKETTPAAVATVILHCYTNSFNSNSFDKEPGKDTPLGRLVTPAKVSRSQQELHLHNLIDVYLLSDRLLLNALKKEVCIRLFDILNYFFAGNMAPTEQFKSMVQYMYSTLPSGDDMVRPILTGWLVPHMSGSVHCVDHVLALAKKEDTLSYKAAMTALEATSRDAEDLVTSYLGFQDS